MEACPLDLAACAMPECRSGICARTGEATLAACWECGFVHVGRLVVGACVRCHPRDDASAVRAFGKD